MNKFEMGIIIWKVFTWIIIFPIWCLSECVYLIIDEFDNTKNAIEGAEGEIRFLENYNKHK